MTLADRLAEAMPCARTSSPCTAAVPLDRQCGACQLRPAMLALLEAVRAETIKECRMIYETSLDDAHANQRMRALMEPKP